MLATNQWGWAWLETRDGGKTWAPIYPSLRPLLANGLALQLLDGAHGVAGNSLQGFGSVLRTDDGGRSWRQVGRIAGEGIAALSFPDSQHGWAITGGSVGGHLVHHVYTTADGGATWALTPGYADLSGRYSAIDMVDRQTGYIGSYNDPFLVTHDRGATWAPVDSATPGSPTFRFASPSEGWMVRDGQLFATADGARTWTQLPLACHVMDVDLLPAGAGWLVVDSCPGDAAPALLATTDAGKTWTRVVIPDVGLTAISFADPLHGWLADNRGRLFMTDDGGLKWTEVLSNQAP